MADIDTKLLKSFLSVARTGSMTVSAHQTHQTQGAVSQQIKRLEALLGQKLFLRSAQGLRLTPQGQKLVPDAAHVIASCKAIFATIGAARPAAAIRFGMPYDLVAVYLERMLHQVSRTYPDIDIDLHCSASPELKRRVEAGELDLALIEEPLSHPTGDVLRVEPLVWMGKPGGRAPTKRPLPVSLVARSCAFRPGVESALAAADLDWRTVFENGDLNATIATVRSDMSVTASLRSLVPPDLSIVPRTEGLPDLQSYVISVYPQSQNLTGSVHDLSTALRDIFAPQPGKDGRAPGLGFPAPTGDVA